MGYTRHHAIVVTGPYLERVNAPEEINYARVRCAEIAKGSCVFVSEVTPKAMNGYGSFLVAPDGSKEGWKDSEDGDEIRNKIVDFLNSTRYSDGSSPLAWVEVQFDDDEKETKVIRDSDHP